MLTGYKLRRIELDKDIEAIYQVFSDYKEQYLLCSVMNANNLENFRNRFERSLNSNYKDFVILECGGSFAGFIASYDYKIIDRHIKAMIYIVPTFRNGPLGLAGIDFMNILFQYYDINKVYTEVYAYNLHSIDYHKRFGFNEECRLKEYKYFDGKFWDVIFYSMNREAFYKKYSAVITRFLKPNGNEGLFCD